MLGIGSGKVKYPLTNNSVYTVPSDYYLNYCPLMECSSDNEQDVNGAQWLHPNGSVVAENGLPYHQQTEEDEYTGAGLWRDFSYILTALDEQELICEVTHPSGKERLHVRVQLPRGGTCMLFAICSNECCTSHCKYLMHCVHPSHSSSTQAKVD